MKEQVSSSLSFRRHFLLLLLLSLRLFLHQSRESSSFRHQRFVIAHFFNDSFVNNRDDVCGFDGAESMGDDEHRATGDDLVQRLLDDPLRLGVESGSGFIEDEDARVL